MLHRRFRRFLADEDGLGTIWSLMWFFIACVFAGLAIDTTDGLRTRTMLQSTADSAALGAAIELPNAPSARANAVFIAQDNMAPTLYGHVLDVRDVHVGRWDPATQSLDESDPKPDSVMVTTRRGQENTNPLPVSFLQIIGMEAWNVRAQAVAQKYVPECLREGLIARNKVYISSNNQFVNNICVHGKKGVQVSSNNFFELGVAVSMYDIDTFVMPDSGFDSNIGLKQALRESGLDPRMVDHVDEIMQAVLDKDPTVLPAYIDPTLDVQEVPPTFDFRDAVPGTIYHVVCDPAESFSFAAKSTITEIAIIADCAMSFDAKVTMSDVFLGSRNFGNGDITEPNIVVNAQVQFGLADNCADGGGVQMFSNASMLFNAQTTFDGAQLVAAGMIYLAAQEEAVRGISAQAGMDISLTSNDIFGLCDGGVPDLFTVPYYRLVL